MTLLPLLVVFFCKDEKIIFPKVEQWSLMTRSFNVNTCNYTFMLRKPLFLFSYNIACKHKPTTSSSAHPEDQ